MWQAGGDNIYWTPIMLQALCWTLMYIHLLSLFIDLCLSFNPYFKYVETETQGLNWPQVTSRSMTELVPGQYLFLILEPRGFTAGLNWARTLDSCIHVCLGRTLRFWASVFLHRMERISTKNSQSLWGTLASLCGSTKQTKPSQLLPSRRVKYKDN